MSVALPAGVARNNLLHCDANVCALLSRALQMAGQTSLGSTRLVGSMSALTVLYTSLTRTTTLSARSINRVFVTTLAGNIEVAEANADGEPLEGCPPPCLRGVPGYRDGNVTFARFYFPSDVAAVNTNGTRVRSHGRARDF